MTNPVVKIFERITQIVAPPKTAEIWIAPSTFGCWPLRASIGSYKLYSPCRPLDDSISASVVKFANGAELSLSEDGKLLYNGFGLVAVLDSEGNQIFY